MTRNSSGIEILLLTSDSHRHELMLTLEGLRRELESSDLDATCGFFEDGSHRNRFLWAEWWRGREEAERAMQSPRFRALLGAVRVLGKLEELCLVLTEDVPASQLLRADDSAEETGGGEPTD